MNYTEEVNCLIERQMRNWQTVAQNYGALERVETRDLQLGGSTVCSSSIQSVFAHRQQKLMQHH